MIVFIVAECHWDEMGELKHITCIYDIKGDHVEYASITLQNITQGLNISMTDSVLEITGSAMPYLIIGDVINSSIIVQKSDIETMSIGNLSSGSNLLIVETTLDSLAVAAAYNHGSVTISQVSLRNISHPLFGAVCGDGVLSSIQVENSSVGQLFNTVRQVSIRMSNVSLSSVLSYAMEEA